MSEPTSQAEALLVAKRDGSTEPFVVAKLQDCFHKGLQAGSEALGTENTTANGLAEAICQYLLNQEPESATPSSTISELVEHVLTETGYANSALAIQQYSRWREHQRRFVLVATPRSQDGRFVQHRWKKSHVVQHLRRKQGLEAPVARLMAGRVEQLILGCGLRVVTAGLVLEMIKSELLAWGLLPGALVVKKTRANRDYRKVKDNCDRV